MSSQFFSAHEVLDLKNRKGVMFGNGFYKFVRYVIHTTSVTALPRIHTSSLRNETERLVSEFEHIIDEVLQNLRKSPTWLQKQLLEAVVLHMYMTVYGDRVSRELEIILGVMIQQRLVRVLCCVRQKEVKRLIHIGMQQGMNYWEWKLSIVGALAEAKTILTLSENAAFKLYSPTEFDDAILGIDLFAVYTDDTAGSCISIKSRMGAQTSLWHDRQRPENPDMCDIWGKLLYGVQLFNANNGLNWIPALLQVGTPYGQNHQLQQHETVWIRELIRRMSIGTIHDHPWNRAP